MGALRRTLPDLPAEELFWRVQFMFGAMAQVLRGPHLIPMPEGFVESGDAEEMAERLVGFVAAGFHAPVTAAVQER
jgi:hypothetical protein